MPRQLWDSAFEWQSCESDQAAPRIGYARIRLRLSKRLNHARKRVDPGHSADSLTHGLQDNAEQGLTETAAATAASGVLPSPEQQQQ